MNIYFKYIRLLTIGATLIYIHPFYRFYNKSINNNNNNNNLINN